MKRSTEYRHIPCVGCGYCCMKAPCSVIWRMMLFWTGKPIFIKRCPALYWNGERYACRLAAVSARARELLVIGAGCTSSLNSWRQEKGGLIRRWRGRQ